MSRVKLRDMGRPDGFAAPLLVDAGGPGVLGVPLRNLDFFGEAEFLEEPDAVVVDVELVPDEAVARGDGVGVMVVVPAFAAGEQGNPPGVAGIVLGFEAAGADEVGGGVDQPGGVEADDATEHGAPEHHAEAAHEAMAGSGEGGADADLEEADQGDGEPMELGKPDVALVAGEVRSVASQEGGFGVHGAAGDDPAGVCPPGTVVRSVGVAFVVGVLMMDAVGGDPEDGSAFKRHGAAGGDEVLDPLAGAIAAMGQQAVVAHADAHVDGEEVGDDGGGGVLPGEEEERGDGADVEQAHDDGGDPVDAAFLVLAAHAEVHFGFAGGLGEANAGGFDGVDGDQVWGDFGFKVGGCFSGVDNRSHWFV